ncbi:uncharacterized protein LOC143275587 [Babylonia areolata]|uniref:uncharacterized protein LOC143275587 n=1 Tax=Babylonia areolata TaxID=304850 RepID=UPI003FD5FFA3
MGCCWSATGEKENHSDFIIDVEKILHDYVWKSFKARRPFWQKLCLRRKDFHLDVPMNYFHFEKIFQDVAPPKTDPALAPITTTTTSQRPPTLAQGVTHMGRDVTHNAGYVTALSTDFTNGTGKEQTYTFRFEKTRKASMAVTFQKGFTVGGKVNFSLGLPRLPAAGGKCSVGGEVDMRINVSKTTGETVEETLTWTASSDIKVAEHSNYTAEVLLSEVPVSYTFTVRTKMYMPHVGAPVTVTRRKGGDFRWTKIINDLELVFANYRNAVDFHPEPAGSSAATSSVIFTTTGIVDGVRLSNQRILLNGKPLQGSSSPEHCPQGPPFPRSALHNGGVVTSDPDDTEQPPPTAGRMLALASSHQSPPIKEVPGREEEVVEEDGGVGESNPPVAVSARGQASRPAAPPITITTGSLASSPLSDTGSPDSKKSQAITTV